MSIDIFVGTWALIGSFSIGSEIEFIDEEPDPNGVKNWLNGKSYKSIEQIERTEGLTLNITFDGKFAEEKTGNPNVQWFDVEGVLESEVIPFNGSLKISESNVYLIPNEILRSEITSDLTNKTNLRYDDGDTKISDFIEVRDDSLIRTVNVVTDELYLDRTVIVYQRIDDRHTV